MPTNPAAVLAIQVDANTLQANAALAKTQAQLKTTAATANASTAVMKKALLGVGAVAIGAGVALFKIGEEFDKASDTIRTKTGATGKELSKLEGSFKNVVSSVPVDFDMAAQAVAGLNQRLDLSGKPLERLAKQISALSKITGTDIKENVESITRLFGDWSVKSKDQTGTLDELFRLTQVTGIGFSDLSRLMVQFGSPLRQLGFHFEESAAMFARFEREGVNMQTLLPGLRMALKNIAVPTDDLAKLFKQLGINTRDPHEALLQIFDVLSKDKVSETDQTLLASSVFGGRAWADMKAAIEEGRFEFDDLIKTMKGGNETIRGSERSTRDFSEQWQLFKNRVMVWLEPLAATVFKGLGNAMKELSRLMKGKGGFAGAVGDAADALKDFWNDSAIFREAMKLMFDITKRVWAGIKDIFAGQIKIIRGIVKVISGVLTGNFGRAWDGVKDIFRGSVQAVIGIFRAISAPFRAIGARVGGVLVDAFKDMGKQVVKVFVKLTSTLAMIGNAIVKVFRSVASVILKVVHFIVDAVNKAVSALGDLKDKIPSVGVSMPSIPGIDPAGQVIGGVAGLFQRGGKIPGPSTGDKVPLVGEGGEYMVNARATRKFLPLLESINRGVPRFQDGGFVGMQPGAAALAKTFLSKFGGVMSSGFRPGDPGFHGRGQAFDWVGGNWGGATRYANQIGPQLLEGIHQGPPGSNVSWDSGHQVSSSFWGSDWASHISHIHLAIAKALGALGKFAGGAGQIGKFKIKGTGPLAGMTRAAAEHMRKAANQRLSQLGGGGLGAGVATGPIQQMAHQMVTQIWGAGQWSPFSALEMSEAGWNPRAQNPSSGAAGLAQALPPSKYPPGAWPYQGLDSAKLQLQWMMGYIKSRYGDPAGAWAFHQAHNWYGNGGDFIARRPQLIGVGDRGPERVTVTPLGQGGGRPVINFTVKFAPGTEWLRDFVRVESEEVVEEYRRFDKSEARRR